MYGLQEPESRSDDSESDDCAEHSIDHHDEEAQVIEDELQDIEGNATVEAVAKPRRKRKEASGRKSLSGKTPLMSKQAHYNIIS